MFKDGVRRRSTVSRRPWVVGDALYWFMKDQIHNQVSVLSSEAVQRIKEIISEDLMRAAAASGGQQRPVMPTLPVYPQPPRPAVPQQPPRLPMPRPPNAQQNQRPNPSHGGHSGVRFVEGLFSLLM